MKILIKNTHLRQESEKPVCLLDKLVRNMQYYCATSNMNRSRVLSTVWHRRRKTASQPARQQDRQRHNVINNCFGQTVAASDR